jgi:hypothetical protein
MSNPISKAKNPLAYLHSPRQAAAGLVHSANSPQQNADNPSGAGDIVGARGLSHVVLGARRAIASVTGLGVVNPSFCGCPFAGVVLLYGVGAQAAT